MREEGKVKAFDSPALFGNYIWLGYWPKVRIPLKSVLLKFLQTFSVTSLHTSSFMEETKHSKRSNVLVISLNTDNTLEIGPTLNPLF